MNLLHILASAPQCFYSKYIGAKNYNFHFGTRFKGLIYLEVWLFEYFVTLYLKSLLSRTVLSFTTLLPDLLG